MTRLSRRLASIDAFRALTMLLMIFVNDLILVEKVPSWLEHAEQGEDRLGFADTIFPIFLFIVGLSIPMAFRHGWENGLSRRDTLWRVLRRSFALLVMGFFIVNYEEYTKGPALLSQFVWMLIAVIAFFFVWLVYPSEWSAAKKALFRGVGIATLVFLAAVYKGGTVEHPAGMEVHWYGILGLIGWAYLTCSLLYLYIGDRLPALTAVFIFFILLSVSWNAGWTEMIIPEWHWFWIQDSGGLCAFTMAGILTTLYYQQAARGGAAKMLQALLKLVVLAVVLLAAGFALRPIGGIAKLEVTPSWILICTAISLACFVFLAYVVDLRGKQNWYRLIRPAGTITLTCYLLPYIHFAIFRILGEQYRLPVALRTGTLGIIKSFAFAFVIVLLTGVLEKRKIKLSV